MMFNEALQTACVLKCLLFSLLENMRGMKCEPLANFLEMPH